jgi:hypothetical protein
MERFIPINTDLFSFRGNGGQKNLAKEYQRAVDRIADLEKLNEEKEKIIGDLKAIISAQQIEVPVHKTPSDVLLSNIRQSDINGNFMNEVMFC